MEVRLVNGEYSSSDSGMGLAAQASRPSSSHGNSQQSARLVSTGGAAAKAAVSQAVKKAPEPATPVKRTMEEAAAGLPSGATWGAVPANNFPRNQSVESIERPVAPLPPASVDDSAWPSLGSTSNLSVPAPNGTFRHRGDENGSVSNGHNLLENHRRSMSMSTGSMDRAPSCSSLDQMSQDPSQELQRISTSYSNVPPHLADAFASAQVFSTVQVRTNYDLIAIAWIYTGTQIHSCIRVSAETHQSFVYLMHANSMLYDYTSILHHQSTYAWAASLLLMHAGCAPYSERPAWCEQCTSRAL